MKPVKIGILGLGTVASGVVSILKKNITEIMRRTNQSIIIEAIYVRTLHRDNPHNLPLTTNINDIINNSDIDVVVELMGGINDALNFITIALKNGQSVITANKELIAQHGNDLLEIAQKHNSSLRFEAAVAGGIPILKVLREGLAANEIESIMGIINGTSNYILTMMNKGYSFEKALTDAQMLGYAEADPTFDIKGIDAAHKLSILATMAFGIPFQFSAIHIEGIDTIPNNAVHYAKKLGYTIKHLGIAKKQHDRLELRVHPTLIPNSHLFSMVNEVKNGLLIQGNAVGEIFNYGPGAGGEATASAVLADLIDLMHAKMAPNYLPPSVSFQLSSLNNYPIAQKQDFTSQYFLLFEDASFAPEWLQNRAHQENIGIHKFEFDEQNQTFLIITEKTIEKNLENLLNNDMLINATKNISTIRVETFS